MTDPKTLDSRIKAGRHSACFINEGQLFVELDGEAVKRIAQRIELVQEYVEEAVGDVANQILSNAGVQSYVQQVTAALAPVREFREEHPMAAWALALLAKKGIKKIAWKLSPRIVGSGSALTAVGVIILIEIVVIVVRWTELYTIHQRSNDGGVLIYIHGYNPQRESIFYPRGGFKGDLTRKAQGLLEQAKQNADGKKAFPLFAAAKDKLRRS